MSRPIFALVGASGSGKTTLVEKVVRMGQGRQIVLSTTTREPRDTNERRHYRFVEPSAFKRLASGDDLLNMTCYDGHAYGFQKADVVAAVESTVGLCIVLTDGIVALRGAGYKVLMVKVEPKNWQPPVRPERAGADQAVRQCGFAIRPDLVLTNDFRPGGLDKAAAELNLFIKSNS